MAGKLAQTTVSSITGILLIVAAALLAGAVAIIWVSAPRGERRRIFPRFKACTLMKVPELRPSAGLAWSRRHYPQQYEESNWRTVKFLGLNDFENERFLDVGGRAYSRQFLSTFSYTDPGAQVPQVRLQYLRSAETFVGNVTGRGLKPNFAYQLKLRGLFQDREAFERIGYAGRWRLPGPGTNYTDGDYESYDKKSEVEAYLLFDFMVTDCEGKVQKEFYADSSLHVLWNPVWQRRPGLADATAVEVVRAGTDPLVYANPRMNFSPEWVWGQGEGGAGDARGRRGVGRSYLPPARYRADVVLTEESFHGYGDAGCWATVMSAPVEFEILEQERPPVEWEVGVLVESSLSLEQAVTENITDVVCTSESLEGAVSDELPDGEFPLIAFAEELDLPGGTRYYLAAELLTTVGHWWSILVDSGEGFDEMAGYRMGPEDCSGWRKFEVEITGRTAGRKVRIAIVPPRKRRRIGVRNVAIYAIED